MVTVEISNKSSTTGIRLERGAMLHFELADGIEFTVQNGKPLTPLEVYNQIGVKQPFNKPIWINRKGVL